VHLFWRIRILLWLPLVAAGWFLLRGYGLLGGAAVAALIEGIASYQTRDVGRAAPLTARADARRPARPASLWDTDATPSPGEWQLPPGCLPTWNWAPPGGLRSRFDRVPLWVRLWYRTPIIDRYARTPGYGDMAVGACSHHRVGDADCAVAVGPARQNPTRSARSTSRRDRIDPRPPSEGAASSKPPNWQREPFARRKGRWRPAGATQVALLASAG
jgi:hypothetical protein